MAVLEKRDPTAGELRWFGVMLAAFAGVLGGVVVYASGALVAAMVIWAIGVVLTAVYYGLPPTRYLLFQGWMTLFFPVGWLISHLLMAFVFYLLITPLALVMRAIGRDALGKSPDPGAETYWSPLEAKPKATRYFQQF